MAEDEDDYQRWRRYREWEKSQGAKRAERTVLEIWDEWIALHPPNSRSVSARRAFRPWLELVFTAPGGQKVAIGHMRPSELTSTLLIAWQNAIGSTPGRSGKILVPGSVNQVRMALQAMLSKAVDSGELLRNPLKHGVPKPVGHDRRREGYMTPALVKQVAAHLPFVESAIFRHTYDTGARTSNIRCLKKTEIDWRESKLILTLKGGKRKSILVPDHTLKEMKLFADISTSEYVYPSPRDPAGQPVARSTYITHCNNAYAAAGITHLAGERPNRHHLRHGRAVEILQRTHDITLVKRQLGHSSIATTMRYADKDKAQDARLRDALNKRDDDDTDE